MVRLEKNPKTFEFVLSEGKIAEHGKHDDLVALGGIYAELHYKQLLEKELEEIN